MPKKSRDMEIQNDSSWLLLASKLDGKYSSIIGNSMPQKEKDHFHLPFLNQMLERLARHEYYYFLDEYSGYTQIPIAPQGQEKTTF